MVDNDCPFCEASVAVMSNDLAYARYDKFPVSPGHVLIVPFRHIADFFDTTEEEKRAMLRLVQQLKPRLDVEWHPDGYNVGINCGTAAGQSVPHVHLHMIPRYRGDMENPLGGVRGVIPDKQKYCRD
jgi:diadenosine tetraphosphate (Ap4A) HIT family hydrolase